MNVNTEKFKIGDTVIAEWDVQMPKNLDFSGKVISVNKLNIIVEFNCANGALDKIEKFTLRKDGTYKPARWHWALGVPIIIKMANV